MASCLKMQRKEKSNSPRLRELMLLSGAIVQSRIFFLSDVFSVPNILSVPPIKEPGCLDPEQDKFQARRWPYSPVVNGISPSVLGAVWGLNHAN